MAANRSTLAVLMTSFNRREQTLRCLKNLHQQNALTQVEMTVFLVDDASKDGTAQAVRAAYPDVEVLHGNGQLYWNLGMRLAFARALARGFDFYLWLNDDTQLFPEALQTLLVLSKDLQEGGTQAILTGTTCDDRSGLASYGGQRWRAGGWKRELQLAELQSDDPVACDTMNGNCTLIPRRVAEVVGNLDDRFTHSFGDFDYGFRAVAAGFPILAAPGFVGTCSDNSRHGTWRDRSSTLKQRWKHLNSVKGSPFPEWSVYCRRHLGPLWPLYAVSPYVKTVLARSTAARVRRGA